MPPLAASKRAIWFTDVMLRERDRETERQRERQRGTERDRERHRERHTERHTERADGDRNSITISYIND